MLEFLNQNSGAFAVIFSAIVAISTIVYACLTWKLVSETRKMRKIQTEPLVSLKLQYRDDFETAIDLIIKNIGKGSAKNINFNIEPNLIDPFGRLVNDRNIIKSGIEYLEPNQEVRTTVAVITDYENKYKDKIYKIDINYHNIKGDKLQDVFKFDFSDFVGLSELKDDSLKKVANSIANIERNLLLVLNNSRRLQINTYNSEDRKEEHKKQLEREEEYFKQSKKNKK